MADHAVGSKISLISKSEIRYEGYLHYINPDENTVALRNVRMFGTEGRKGDSKAEIPAGDQLYDFIIFRGGDIKDLTVYEETPRDPAIVTAQPSRGQQGAQPKGQDNTRRDDRAGARQAPPVPSREYDRSGSDRNARDTRDTRDSRGGYNRDQPQTRTYERRDDRGYDRRDDRVYERRDDRVYDRRDDRRDDRHDNRGYDRGYDRRDDRHNDRRDERGYDRDRSYNDRGYGRDGGRDAGRDRYGGGRGGYSSSGSRQGGHTQPQQQQQQQRKEAHTGRDFQVAPNNSKAKEEFKEAFDFGKANEQFDKSHLALKTESETQAKDDAERFEQVKKEVTQRKAYDKTSSFFDSISCETSERLARGNTTNPRVDRESMNRVDTETFGREMVGSHRGVRRHRGRGRFGGRY